MAKKVPAREDISKVKEQLRNLKAKCRKLQKDNKVLQKQLQIFEMVYDSQEMTEARRVAIKEKRIPSCDECGADGLEITKIGVWTLETCLVCGYRGRSQDDTD